MVRHGPSAVIAVVLVLLGSVLQMRARRRVAGDDRPLPTSAAIVILVAPAALVFTAGAVAYVRLVGLGHSGNARVATVLVAVALAACAAYTLVVGLVALAVAVANHGVRRAWSSLWVMTATSVAAAVLLPMGWGR